MQRFGGSGVRGFRGSGLGAQGWGRAPGRGGDAGSGPEQWEPSVAPSPPRCRHREREGRKGEEKKKIRAKERNPLGTGKGGREGGGRRQGTARRGNRRSSCSSAPSPARPPAPPGGTEPARPVGWGPPRAPPAPRSAGAPRGDEGSGAAGRAPPPGKGGAAVPAPASIPMGAAAPNHGGWGPIGLLIRGASIRRATAGCPRCHLLAASKRLGWQPRSQPYTRRWVLFPCLRSVPWLGMGCGEPRRAMPYIHCGSICAFAIKMIITNIPKSRCAKSPLPNGVGFKPKQFS